MIEFRVIDNGIGIAGEDLGRVFDDFVTIDSSYSRRAEGTGLGLGICRRMTEAMGGEIGVESSLGIGSKFWIRIPSRKEEADQRASATHLDIKAVQTASAATQTPLSILVVEDNQINRFVAREFLESMGHEVHEAHDGLEGVSIAEQYRFDAILMDISMPVLDGVGATERIRTGEGKSAGAAIIGLTAHALPEEQARFRQAGMEMCLPKPISREKLGLALSTIMPGQVQAGQTAALGAAEPSILNGYIDTQVVGDLRDMLGPERFRKMFGKFREEVDGTLFRIVVPGDAKSFDDARKLVHKLSGSAGTFGASRLQARLSAIESSCKSQDAALFARNLDGLDDIWRRSVEDFESLH